MTLKLGRVILGIGVERSHQSETVPEESLEETGLGKFNESK